MAVEYTAIVPKQQIFLLKHQTHRGLEELNNVSIQNDLQTHNRSFYMFLHEKSSKNDGFAVDSCNIVVNLYQETTNYKGNLFQKNHFAFETVRFA